MRRLVKVFVSVIFTLLSLQPAFASKDYQDWWWDPAQSGMGFNVGHQGNTAFVMWFLYGDDGKATFLQLAGPISGEVLQGTLYRTAGQPPGPTFNPAAVSAAAAGTASIRFTSENTALFTYSYEGKAGSINLQRYTFGSFDFSGRKRYAGKGTLSSCSSAANNGVRYSSGDMTFIQSANSLTVYEYSDNGGVCVSQLNLTQRGVVATGSGVLACSGNIQGNLELDSLRKVDDVIIGEYSIRYTSGETCEGKAKFVAVEE